MFCDHAAMPAGTKANGYSIVRPRNLGRKENAGTSQIRICRGGNSGLNSRLFKSDPRGASRRRGGPGHCGPEDSKGCRDRWPNPKGSSPWVCAQGQDEDGDSPPSPPSPSPPPPSPSPRATRDVGVARLALRGFECRRVNEGIRATGYAIASRFTIRSLPRLYGWRRRLR